MSEPDLPLFRWQPSRKVLFFPLQKRVGKIRHVADKLAGKQGEDAELYRKQVLAGLRRNFEHVGLSQDEASAETRAFFEAVQAEMVRLAYSGRSNGGAGTA